MAMLVKLIKKVFTRALPLLTGLTIATTSQAFDAGTSDPNLREFDRLVNGTGGDNCRIEVGYLQASQNLTQLLVVTDRGGAYNQYHYNGGYYRSSNNTWSSSESAYNRFTTGVADDLTTMSASTLATDCGWTSATITDLTPSSGFGASGTSFDAADTASIRLDYVYNGRSFSATATISGGASAVPAVSSNYTGTPGAPTSLVATPQNGSASIAFTAPSDLPSDPGESDNAIVNYEYSLDGGSTWVALSPAVASSPVVISGLTNGTTYSVTLRGVNGVGTGIASSAVSVVPADTTAPTFDTAPSASSVTSSGFTPSASIDEAGVIYYVVVADGDTAPSVAQVKAGNNNSNTAAAAAASSTVSSSPFDSSFSTITSLTAGTAYDVYFVGADDESTPNDQSSVTKVEITTLAQAGCDLSGYLGASYSNFTSPISADSTASFYFRTAMRTAASNGDDITGCDVSGIEDFSQLFYNRTSFDQDISSWDVSSGTNFSYMLANTSFDSDISGWEVGRATNIAGMFASNTAFNQDISSWNVSSVTLFNQVFSGASFNQNISSWDVSSGTTFRAMFENNTVFDNDISSWSVQNIADLQSMFNGASAFKTTFSVDNTPPLSFFTGDLTAPTVASSSPSDGATGVSIDADIVLTFSEAVDAETGDIVIKKTSDDTAVETFDVTTDVTGSGTTTITINPTSDFAYSTSYYVTIASTAFDDAASNSYAGITDATTLNFTTAAAPPPPTPANVASVADAGSDQTVASATAVTLDGSGSSDPDSGDTLTYAWTQTSGTTVTLSSATAEQPTFTAPTLNVGDADAVLVFSLVVNDGTVNSAADTASITVEAPAPTPASEFAEHEAEIRNTLVGDASRSLRNSVSANRRLAQSARDRFVEFRQARAREEDVTRALIPFDVDGNFTLSEAGLSTAGNFFQQVGNEEGTYRRLFFGDFDAQHNSDTNSTTATLAGRMAWEQMTSEQTMLGYFIGGELATSNIGGSFEGDQDRIGVTAGGFVVHELAEQVYFDGFASVGAGRNNLEMANDTLSLESEYTTQTATLGGAITGVYRQKGYDFKPELAFSFGKTWLGDIGFTGRAYGLVDNTLSLDAGYVSIASLTFRPEVIIPIGADFVADTNTQLSFAPRLVCEQIKSTTKTSDCGTGGELGFSSTSADGLSSADMRVLLDRINGGTRSSFAFSVEHKF